MTKQPQHTCPLCDHLEVAHFYKDKRRDYFQCQQCKLVFVPKPFHLNSENEKAEYDKHDNQLEDIGYLSFLSRVAKPVITKLSNADIAECFANNNRTTDDFYNSLAEIEGLDFGCGPGPALATELSRLGFKMSLYDIYYHDDKSNLNRQYDFVTCTEVVEHFNEPATGIKQLFNLVKPGGMLAIMTKLVINQQRFKHWHYKNDPTHISFFSEDTFSYIAQHYNLELEFTDQDVILLKKPA